jgi:hypothetical protein
LEEGFEGLLRDKTRPSRIKPLDGEAAERVVALLTSHHTIVKVGSTVVTLPSNDIAQIVALTPKP